MNTTTTISTIMKAKNNPSTCSSYRDDDGPSRSRSNSIPMREHCFAGHTYGEYTVLIFKDVVIPWWKRPERPYFSQLLQTSYSFRDFNPRSRYEHRDDRLYMICTSKIFNWVWYWLDLPMRCGIAIVRLIVAPVLYPSLYLLCRELICLPQERRDIRYIVDRGRRTTGEIKLCPQDDMLRIVFEISDNNNNNDGHSIVLAENRYYQCVFCNSRTEVQTLIGQEYDTVLQHHVGEQVDIIRIPFNVWRHEFYLVWTIATGMQRQFQGGDAADGYEILTPRLLRARQQAAPDFQIREFGTSLLLALCWWNIAGWILVHVPMIAYNYYLTGGYNLLEYKVSINGQYLNDRTLLFIVWWNYKSAPLLSTAYIIGGLIVPSCFRPLSGCDHFVIANNDPASTIVQ